MSGTIELARETWQTDALALCESYPPIHFPSLTDLDPSDYLGRNQAYRQWYRDHADLLRPIHDAQHPHTFWIGCADSRIVPEQIIGAGPGEVFVHRNVGIIVVRPNSRYDGMSAALTYAVAHLKVPHVVVCGHRDCGAMKALSQLDSNGVEPELARWLSQAEPILKQVPTDVPDPVQALVEANVPFQMEQLLHHPAVRDRLQGGMLTIHGLVYDVTDGSLRELARHPECKPP